MFSCPSTSLAFTATLLSTFREEALGDDHADNKTLEKAEYDQRNDKLDEEELVRNLKPLLEQGTTILNETHGSIKALDPTGSIARNAKNKSAAHQATPQEYYLAEQLSKVSPEPASRVLFHDPVPRPRPR